MKESRRSICPYDCPNTCGFLMEVVDGKIIKVKNDPDHPVSCGGICRKTAHYEKDIYSDKRILTPLKRSGAKGSGSFSPIAGPTTPLSAGRRILRCSRNSLCPLK